MNRNPKVATLESEDVSEARSILRAVKDQTHRELLNRIDLEFIDQLSREQVNAQIAEVARQIMNERQVRLNSRERELVIKQIQDEVMGLGPIEPLLADPSVSDILVNTWRQVYVERHGKLELTDVQFQNDGHLMRVIDKIASAVGRRVDESSPMVDARLEDGSRVNVIIPPASVDGPILSIRKFSVDPLVMDDLVGLKTLTPPMAQFLSAAVRSRVNVLISGGTGSGKTTLLNALSGYIPDDERVVTIEDSAELQLQRAHVVRLETRPPNIEGEGEITQRELVNNSLRMRPDRIIVGEVRGAEALDMLQAMNTGHDGSMTTIHANSPRDALTRLEHMVGMSGVAIPATVIRQQIAAAINLLVDQERLLDGRRVITSIQEITGMEGDVVEMQEIFLYKKRTVDEQGRVVGHFHPTGIRPKIVKQIAEYGIDLDPDLFDPNKF
ncbi:MAG: CpaF family protein [Pseudomonadales bacterium]|nr:CpaF family protein [Pseudomonadales bacterium]MCP5348230.1 CpaF family protein [Pseudomonadales bacterium]